MVTIDGNRVKLGFEVSLIVLSTFGVVNGDKKVPQLLGEITVQGEEAARARTDLESARTQ